MAKIFSEIKSPESIKDASNFVMIERLGALIVSPVLMLFFDLSM